MLKEYLDAARNPVLLLSGGRDSVLLLEKIRAIRGEIDCVCFATDFTREQWGIIESLIREWNLEVYTIPPMATYFIPNGDGLARVDEYGLGPLTFPVMRDLVHSDGRCALDASLKRLEAAPLNYDVVFLGTRKADHSAATGLTMSEPVVRFGEVTFVAPLWDYSDAEVLEEAAGLPDAREFYEEGREEFDTGNAVFCSRCLQAEAPVFCPKAGKEIESVKWDKAAALKFFREKFGFGAVRKPDLA
jgi:hypothetical protein